MTQNLPLSAKELDVAERCVREILFQISYNGTAHDPAWQEDVDLMASVLNKIEAARGEPSLEEMVQQITPENLPKLEEW
jgi:hypothetical protein